MNTESPPREQVCLFFVVVVGVVASTWQATLQEENWQHLLLIFGERGQQLA